MLQVFTRLSKPTAHPSTVKSHLCFYNHMKNAHTTHVEKPIRFKTVSIRNSMLLSFLAGQADQLTARMRKGSAYKWNIPAIGLSFSESFWENGPWYWNCLCYSVTPKLRGTFCLVIVVPVPYRVFLMLYKKSIHWKPRVQHTKCTSHPA